MELVVTTSLTPNILAHIYASAGLTRNKQYHERFRHTLREEDVEFLKTFTSHFRGTPPMAGGPMFLYLYQIPSYLPAESLDEVLGNIDRIVEGLGSGSIECMGLDQDTVSALDIWMPRQLFEYPSPNMVSEVLEQITEILNRLKEVIAYSSNNYYAEHWRELKPLLLRRATELKKEFEGLPVFNVWSEALGLTFPYNEFVVYLCEARRGGTSLLAEKIALPYDIPLEKAVDTIIHEVGIHFIIRPEEYLKRGLTVEGFMQHQGEIGRMEEATTCYFKPRVYERLGLTLKEDYHLPLMKIEDEIQRYAMVWERDEPADVFEGLLKVCRLV
ncbi:MAG: hypothetical protein OEZ44_11230 [Candidatus Bathyarchaeota archaeon]|nr:hypothetical protein [Candidatus Bathyarchaeota archaeon]